MSKFQSQLVRSGLLSACLLLFAVCSAGESQSDLKAQAKITQKQALKIALAKVPNGKVKSFVLEMENGKLVWSFDISIPKSKNIAEIHVDAKTGEVVSNLIETPADQAIEAVADKAEKKNARNK